MNELTEAVVQYGTGTAARIVPNAHGKTGTSEEYTDAWFCGYTPDLVTAVWAGNRNNAEMEHIFGGTVAAPVWANYMKEAVVLNPAKKNKPLIAHASRPKRERPKRERREEPTPVPFTGDSNERNVLRVTVCSETGMLAREGCPSTHTEEYLLGDLPGRCTLHGDSKPKEKKEKPEGEAKPAEAEDGTTKSPDQ
jgi:membrane peptidoglycan carboxypeptidase